MRLRVQTGQVDVLATCLIYECEKGDSHLAYGGGGLVVGLREISGGS